jgi:hypothetical protein
VIVRGSCSRTESGSYEIVGVVADAKYASRREPVPSTVYLNALQEARGRVSQFALRTDVPPAYWPARCGAALCAFERTAVRDAIVDAIRRTSG